MFCTTLKVMGNSANISEICTGGNSNLSMNLSTVSDLDNTLELSFIENGTPRTVMMVLVEGSIAQSGTVAFIHKTNNIFTGVELETITATDEEAYNPFQVEDKKLVMKSDTSSTGMNNQVSYGFISTTQDPTFIVSLDAELSLMESSISGDARARTAFYQELRSLSTNDVASIFVAIDHRASGIASRAFLKINGVETTISEIHKKPLEKGKSYHFKLDTKPGEDNISLSLAGYTATILKSSFPVSDLYVSKAKFQARVKNSEASNFARGSVDNIVLNRNKDGIYKIITRNFDDGITPVADDEFNSINF